MLSKCTILSYSVLFWPSLASLSLHLRQDVTNACPVNTEYACFDVINSSLCVSTVANRNGTAAEMAKCVTYPGAMSDISGAAKVSVRRISSSNRSETLTNPSCAGAQDAIRRRLTTSLRDYFPHLAHSAEIRTSFECSASTYYSRFREFFIFGLLHSAVIICIFSNITE